MASIVKRGERYQVKWRQDGRQQSQTFQTHREAREHKAHIESQVYRGTAVTPDARDMTVSDWWTYWTATRTVRASTAVTGANLANKHILPALGAVPLSRLTQVQVQQWVGSLDLAPASVKRVYQELRTCMAAAVTAGYLHQTPCRGIALVKPAKKTMVILDHEAIKRLAEAVPERYKALVYLLAYGGLRIGEAIALTPDNVSDKGVYVRATLTRDDKGHETIGAPKTEAGVRFVPLPAPVVTVLEDHMKKYPAPFVFTGKTNERLNYRNFNRRVFAPAAGEGMVIHDLRHTAITHWIRAGVDLPRIAAWAGHTSPAFTLSQYAGYFPDDTDSLMDTLGEGLDTL